MEAATAAHTFSTQTARFSRHSSENVSVVPFAGLPTGLKLAGDHFLSLRPFDLNRAAQLGSSVSGVVKNQTSRKFLIYGTYTYKI